MSWFNSMAYSNNPNLPRVRMEAVKRVRAGEGVRAVARQLNFELAAILRDEIRVLIKKTKASVPEEVR